MNYFADAPSLVLCPPCGPAVCHLVLSVPERSHAAALRELSALDMSFGVPHPADGIVSVGFSFAGLVALQLPTRYQRVFRRLAPAFSQGACRRSARLGPGSLKTWNPALLANRAHVLVSWHGGDAWVRLQADRFEQSWQRIVPASLMERLEGRDLPPPREQQGRWVHFGFRDGITEVVLPGLPDRDVLDPRHHAAGELLLGLPNDSGYNHFALPKVRQKARRFFQGGSFGIFQPMAQNVADFEAMVDSWQSQLAWLDPAGPVSREFVKAKLCGRWPDGRTLAPGAFEPGNSGYDLVAALAKDPEGTGCPFGAHVRRMRPPAADGVPVLPRPLQRRSVPYGPPYWTQPAKPQDAPRGLLGHFFCASIETQFEHLIGQWAERAPLGFAPGNNARDPLIGMHEDTAASFEIPIKDRPLQRLEGFQAWTASQGTFYAWHPDREAWRMLIEGDFVPVEDEEAWL